jgi:hypothetical protein
MMSSLSLLFLVCILLLVPAASSASIRGSLAKDVDRRNVPLLLHHPVVVDHNDSNKKEDDQRRRRRRPQDDLVQTTPIMDVVMMRQTYPSLLETLDRIWMSDHDSSLSKNDVMDRSVSE